MVWPSDSWSGIAIAPSAPSEASPLLDIDADPPGQGIHLTEADLLPVMAKASNSSDGGTLELSSCTVPSENWASIFARRERCLSDQRNDGREDFGASLLPESVHFSAGVEEPPLPTTLDVAVTVAKVHDQTSGRLGRFVAAARRSTIGILLVGIALGVVLAQVGSAWMGIGSLLAGPHPATSKRTRDASSEPSALSRQTIDPEIASARESETQRELAGARAEAADTWVALHRLEENQQQTLREQSRLKTVNQEQAREIARLQQAETATRRARVATKPPAPDPSAQVRDRRNPVPRPATAAPVLPMAAPKKPDPQQALAAYRAGRNAYIDQRFAEAEARFQAAIETDPRDARYHYFLGLARWALGKPESAIDCFQAAARLEKDHQPSPVFITLALEAVPEKEMAILNRYRP